MFKGPLNPAAQLEKKPETKERKGVVLIVDDNTDTVDVTRRTLQSYTEFLVLTAHTGPEALEILEKTSVDVIIMDYVMPEMNGGQCFRSLRDRSVQAPVIFLTGCPSEECKREQLALGAFDYLEKPVRARDLILLVHDAYKAMQRMRNLGDKK